MHMSEHRKLDTNLCKWFVWKSSCNSYGEPLNESKNNEKMRETKTICKGKHCGVRNGVRLRSGWLTMWWNIRAPVKGMRRPETETIFKVGHSKDW